MWMLVTRQVSNGWSLWLGVALVDPLVASNVRCSRSCIFNQRSRHSNDPATAGCCVTAGIVGLSMMYPSVEGCAWLRHPYQGMGQRHYGPIDFSHWLGGSCRSITLSWWTWSALTAVALFQPPRCGRRDVSGAYEFWDRSRRWDVSMCSWAPRNPWEPWQIASNRFK